MQGRSSLTTVHPLQGETAAEMTVGERHHEEHLRPGEGHVQRPRGSSEYSLESQRGVRGETAGEAQGAGKGSDLGDAEEEESTVSGKEKSRMDPSFYLFREK